MTKTSRKKRAVPYVPSPPSLGENLAPEASLCLDFCIEALRYGWDIWPEFPNRRFDMVLVATEGCTTKMPDGTFVPAGIQIGVHAKTTLNTELVHQLKREAGRVRGWGVGPDYVVGLVPAAPRTPKEKKLAATLSGISKHGTVGLLFPFRWFNGHGLATSVRSLNLASTSRFGTPFNPTRRFKPPLIPTFWSMPGAQNTKIVTAWKVNSIKFVEEMLTKQPLDYEGIRKLLSKHKAGDLNTWKTTGWLIEQGTHVDPKTNRTRKLYVLNPDSESRPDIKHSDVAEAIKQHEQAEATRKEHGSGYQGETGYSDSE